MKRFLIILLLVFNLPLLSYPQDVIEKSPVSGSWKGKLSSGPVSLRIVFNISVLENDSLIVTLDSPDQGAKGIRIGPVIFDGNEINIKAPLLLGEYQGTLINDTLIEGIWSQAGTSNLLNLTRSVNGSPVLARPQEPVPPFPYLVKEVTFKNEKQNIILAGTLTMPEGEGPFPAVVLITGSGAQNRDSELMGHKYFWVLADLLTRQGIAVLRYDDRGVGESQGVYSTATSADLATDAEAALAYLKSLEMTDPELTGLEGHSEGGLIAAIVAASNPDVDFIVSMAGTGVTGEDVIQKQNYDIGKLSGVSEEELQKSYNSNKTFFAVIKEEPDDEKAIEKMTGLAKEMLVSENLSQAEEDQAMKQIQSSFGTLTDRWFRHFITTDPAQYWEKISCPVLALNGSKDVQVDADINLKAIEKAVKSGGNTNITVIKAEGLNHTFQHCETGLPSEYGDIEETISPEVPEIIAAWIKSLKK